MQSVNDIRSHFLEYFRGHGHEVVASSPLVPHNDPTLMFTNAGMVQFKNVFTGIETRAYQRAVTSQKCVRAGGKHNDLDNVGYTARHHTFFEMLGNFSFGDYFKERAIELAWNLVTREFGLAAERLLVTVYAEDDAAFELWGKVAGLPDSRIIRIPTSDNFWAMGDTGPCGPCSEIFYDHGPEIAGGPPGSDDEDGDRFVEIWNLVFMQFEQVTPEERIELPKPSIDTGMGLERVAAILQGENDNYETDLFRSLIAASVEFSGMPAAGEHAASHRVVADHLRASAFLIADGVMPSNEGRGYVLRRIMRRAMRYVHLMGCKDPLMWRLVPTLVGEMGQAFSELARAEALIGETLKLEESRFKQTLVRGLKLLSEATAKLGDGEALAGEVAFQLYDTYGFPLDLTEDALRREGRAVDIAGFDSAMERQRAEARKAWAGSGDAATERVWFEIREETGASEFLGYEMESAEGVVLALVKGGTPVSAIEAGADAALVVNQTPFYAESGGQMGDSGVIVSAEGARFIVSDTHKHAGDLIVHMGRVEGGAFRVGDALTLAVDAPRRQALRANHSATHLLHAALRRQLGEHVTQKGSLVAPDRLRFDISHPKAVSAEERDAVEAEVNQRIRENSALVTHLMTPDEAVENGALALFGEKYGEEVRVVSMGEDGGNAYSVELCGGTHVRRSGDIGMFTLISEAAVAAGVRRIEALTGEAARAYGRERDGFLAAANSAIKSTSAELAPRIGALLEERRQLERELGDLRKQLAVGGGGGGDMETREVGGIQYLPRRLDGTPPRELRPMVDGLKKKLGSGVCAIVAVGDGKAALVVGVSEDLTARISAVDLARAGAAALGGKGGGGRPDMAQAGGPDGANADAALQAIETALKNLA
ncbi:MAG: alanine--tRNA ligase [Alphaproteobacteria bacterium]|jgi:alanyl-tRNA synthetase|nr:alanine--tRNA ligase [Alphaproteobacteria bacterium]MDP6818649.1 alanine--tRNA ligase [Alphaproteobacteria bacterium]